MPYIDYAYYTEEYKGAEVDEPTFEKYATRASQVIDQLTNDVLYGQEFTQIAQYLQDKVRLATASQVEFYVVNGGYAELDAGDDYSNFVIGSFQYSKGGASKNKQADRVSPAVISILKPTGLLYRGLDVKHSAIN